ncbi:MAG: hypothetical protein E7649_05730 [Ruminococcaceae bacterium]|nr:hypothetical protein [Oscillospiraceae bacterium]
MDKSKNSIFEISHSDTLRFRRIIMEVMSLACDADVEGYDGIGTLGEKQMHAAIKRFICPDLSKHEIKLDRMSLLDSDGSENGKNPKQRRFVADILDGKNVYEIQTGSFAPLVKKIQWILDNTDYNITVIHPMAQTKWVNILGDDGNIIRRYKSPRREKIEDLAAELYYIRDFISCPRFSLVILMLEAEQYKKNVEKNKKRRSKYQKYELIPVNLLRAHIFYGAEDYIYFLPDSLENTFTVKDFSKATGIRGIDAYSMVHTLCHIGLVRENGKSGRATLYAKNV